MNLRVINTQNWTLLLRSISLATEVPSDPHFYKDYNGEDTNDSGPLMEFPKKIYCDLSYLDMNKQSHLANILSIHVHVTSLWFNLIASISPRFSTKTSFYIRVKDDMPMYAYTLSLWTIPLYSIIKKLLFWENPRKLQWSN
jgi:hypothetical protein